MSCSLRKGKLMSDTGGGPNAVDVHVGARVRVRRKALGLSQEALARTLELTFQQVQKYERGTNRISASKLYEIAKTLQVSISYFFDGYRYDNGGEDFVESASEQTVSSFLLTAEGGELAATFPHVKSAKQRRKILELVRTLSDDDA